MRILRNVKFPQNPKVTSKQEKWIRGLNVLVSNTQIRPDELSEAQDIQLVEDGKVQCPRDGQAYYGATSGSRVVGLFSYYKSSGARELLAMRGTALSKYASASSWSAISGFAYTTGLSTNAVQIYDRLYLCNGTDALTYYDGSSITSFTAVSAPAAPTATRTAGSAGTFTFSYKITAVTDVGETTASSAGTNTLNQSAPDASSYFTVTWATITNATGYNVYGRTDGNWFFLAFMDGQTSATYVDKGQDTPNEAFTPPDANQTDGPKGKYITAYKDSLFIFGDPLNPSRLYYSGGGDKINDFTIGSGGGFIDVSKNDGQIGTGMIVFKNSLLVFKEDSSYQFSFTSTGLPQIVQVNPSVGCIAPKSIVAVENDVFFASRRGIFTVGNEAGFAFDVLRTNELSARVRSVFRTVDPAYVQNISAIYTSDGNKNLVIFSYTPAGSTTNTKAIIYDRERLAWYKWSNINANCWTTFRGTDGVNHYLYGDDSSGYVKEILSGSTDFGGSIRGYFRVKSEHFGELNRYKREKDLDIVLRRPSGTIRLSIIKDGVETVYENNIGTISPAINFKHYTFKDFLFKTSYGTGVSAQDENVLRTIRNLNLEGRSFLLDFDNQGTSASFTLLLIAHRAKMKSVNFRKSGELVE